MSNRQILRAGSKSASCVPRTFPVKPIYKLFYLDLPRRLVGLWYWARRRFTLAGLCVAGGFLVAGAVGVDMENNVTYQAFALLLAFCCWPWRSSLFFRARFSATRSCPASAPPASRCLTACG